MRLGKKELLDMFYLYFGRHLINSHTDNLAGGSKCHNSQFADVLNKVGFGVWRRM